MAPLVAQAWRHQFPARRLQELAVVEARVQRADLVV
jgi:hypothetical protein